MTEDMAVSNKMASEQHPKEDLMRDATALVQRIKFSLPTGDSIVVGFRSQDAADGTASFFFGDDPVYQFNENYHLRRGYVGGIIKADQGGLVRLSKVRTGAQVEMRRYEFSSAEIGDFLGDVKSRLQGLRADIGSGDAKVVRTIPINAPVVERVKTWLAKVAGPDEIRIAVRPNV